MVAATQALGRRALRHAVKVPLSRLTVFASLAVLGTIGLAWAATSASGPNTAPARVSASGPADYSAWAVDPTVPGPDLPPAGRSLFDFLITEPSVEPNGDRVASYRVPFPFAALIERIRGRLANREFMGGVRIAIIPTGRSLQRTAAAPAFFDSPRVVVAVTGEPRTDLRDAGMLLKDRLYIGYVEKTATLEVISYNEAAGRFEFQLVKDYRAGARPQVFYADRAICISCHQNHAPIFSRPVWGETNANGRVADLLREHQTDMQLSTQANIDFPDDIDKATMRANALVTLQTVWQRGCALERDPEASRRCRAAAFAAVLQYGLNGGEDFDSSAPRYRDDFVATISHNWSLRWPQGLRVAQSSLPDRDPFGAADGPAFDWKAAAHVPPGMDPLTPRPPKEIWHVAGAMDTPRVISGWAGFFAADDFRTLDRVLAQRAADAGVPRAVYRAQCTATRDLSAAAFALRCTANPRAERSVNLVARVEESGKGRIDWLNFGAAGTLRDVDLTGEPVQSSDAGSVLRVAPRRARLATRLPDGRRLASMEIRWRGGASGDVAAAPLQAQFQAVVVDDFALVQAAIDRLLDTAPGLFDGVLMRARLMPALLAELGASAQTWCCVDGTAIPPARRAAPEVDAAVLGDEKLQPLFRYCATCHFTGERFPPNFLSGEASRVAANLRQCAPRMLVRLSAWLTPERQRVKSPMPPATALHALGTTAQQWAHSKELEQLRAYVEVLTREAGYSPEAFIMAEAGYEGLPACLLPAP